MKYIPVFNNRGKVEFFIDPFSGCAMKQRLTYSLEMREIDPTTLHNFQHDNLLEIVLRTKGLNGEDITTYLVGGHGGDLVRKVEVNTKIIGGT